MSNLMPVDTVARVAQAGVTATAVTFLGEALSSTVIWLMVMVAVVVCSAIVEVRCKILIGERVKVKRTILCSMGNIVTYTSFVFAVCMLEVAAGGSTKIDKICCCLIYGIEIASIIKNLCLPKKINFDIVKFLAVIFKRVFGIAKKDTEEIITNTDKEE